MKNIIDKRDDCEYLETDLGAITYVWNTTLDRLEGCYGLPDDKNPNNRDSRYAAGWFNRDIYASLNPDHKQVHTGHVVGRSLGGIDQGINFICQDAKINNSRYKQIENIARSTSTNAIAIALRYTGDYADSQVPNSIDYAISSDEGTEVYSVDNPVPLALQQADADFLHTLREQVRVCGK